MKKIKVLIADDEPDILEFLEYSLGKEGYATLRANDGIQALEKVYEKPDLIVLDYFLPKLNGIDVCKKIRSDRKKNHIPIILLTTNRDEENELLGFAAGANDYIQKPVSPQKFIARIKSNLRKVLQTSDKDIPKILTIGSILINKLTYEVFIDNKKTPFPKKEFELLYHLSKRPGIVFSREDLLLNVWGNETIVVDRTIDVHIRKIREKLGEHSNLIETIKGVGYRFKNI